MSKQTAVDVYHRHIRHLIAMGLKLSEPDRTFLNSAYRDCKAMEREQIEEAYGQGMMDEINHRLDDIDIPSPEYYYNETYKGGEQ
jgi:hypothetical protein